MPTTTITAGSKNTLDEALATFKQNFKVQTVIMANDMRKAYRTQEWYPVYIAYVSHAGKRKNEE